jgi:hypothetical protein
MGIHTPTTSRCSRNGDSPRGAWLARIGAGAVTIFAGVVCLVAGATFARAEGRGLGVVSLVGVAAFAVLLLVGGVVATPHEPGGENVPGSELVRKVARVGLCLTPVAVASFLSLAFGVPHATDAWAVVSFAGGVLLALSASGVALFMTDVERRVTNDTGHEPTALLPAMLLAVGVGTSAASVWLALYVSPYAIADGDPLAMVVILVTAAALFSCSAWFSALLVRVAYKAFRQAGTGRGGV